MSQLNDDLANMTLTLALTRAILCLLKIKALGRVIVQLVTYRTVV